MQRRKLGWPITLAVTMMVLLATMAVGWVVMSVINRQWVFLATGSVILLLMLVGVVLYLTIYVKAVSLNQRQSNFVDSVTHELKSPIASLKLYLQTLSRGNVTERQQAEFYRFMLEDLARLDNLINHMLDAARLDHRPAESDVVDVPLADVLRNCAKTACQRYRLPTDTITLTVEPTTVRGRPIDVEMVFRNLIDNALRYSGDRPEVRIDSRLDGREMVVTRIADNGPGIPAKWRRKVFGRFVRMGNELERSQSGTGLGLFIVRTLVKRMRGKVTVRGHANERGTTFEVELPARIAAVDPADVNGTTSQEHIS